MDADRHYSGTVAANSETGFIQINVTNAGFVILFILIWFGKMEVASNNLTLKYYMPVLRELHCYK